MTTGSESSVEGGLAFRFRVTTGGGVGSVAFGWPAARFLERRAGVGSSMGATSAANCGAASAKTVSVTTAGLVSETLGWRETRLAMPGESTPSWWDRKTWSALRLHSNVRLPRRNAQERLTRLAEESARASLPDDATNVQVDARPLPERDGRAQVLAYLAYDPTDGTAPRHTAFRWLADDRGRPLAIAIATERCVPKDELLVDIEAVAASWRPLGGEDGLVSDREGASPPVKKPWWKVW